MRLRGAGGGLAGETGRRENRDLSPKGPQQTEHRVSPDAKNTNRKTALGPTAPTRSRLQQKLLHHFPGEIW